MIPLFPPMRRQPPPEVRLVQEAAAALEVREFDVFRAAYRAWYGVEPETVALEKEFVAYMFRQRLPPYVRHFARQVLAEAEAGRLRARPETAGLERRPRVAEPGGVAVAAAVGVAFLAYLLFLA